MQFFCQIIIKNDNKIYIYNKNLFVFYFLAVHYKIDNKNTIDMAPKYTLNYFDLAARGEPIRLMFHAAGVEFNDNRISFADWGSFKADGKNQSASVTTIVQFS